MSKKLQGGGKNQSSRASNILKHIHNASRQRSAHNSSEEDNNNNQEVLLFNKLITHISLLAINRFS